MKICWDELEKYQVWYYAKSGTFRVFKGGQWRSFIYHEACLKCGEPFLNPKSRDRFCCGSCANSYTNIKLGHTWDIEKAKASKLKKYGNENYNGSEKASRTRKNFSKERKKEIELKKEQTWIENYGVSNPNKSREVRKKIEETNIKTYGSPCCWGNKEIWQKSVESTKEKFGVDDDSIVNVGQIPQIKEKIVETNLRNHGVECVLSLSKFRNVKKATESRKRLWENSTDEYRNGYAERTSKVWRGFSKDKKKEINEKRYKTKKENNSWGVSKASQIFFWELYDLLPENLKEHCHFHELNKEFYTCNAFIDFKVGNCIIEFNGDKWHANPEKYGPKDRPRPYEINNLRAEEIWKLDEERAIRLEKEGYKLCVVWASHCKLNKEEQLQKCLDFILKNYK